LLLFYQNFSSYMEHLGDGVLRQDWYNV
jgi:hypothetical protein